MSRYLILDDARTQLIGSVLSPVIPSWAAKDPLDSAIHSADFALVAGLGRSISSVSCAVITNGSAALGLPSVAGTIASVLITGGDDQELATIVFTATLDDGEVLRRSVLLQVVSVTPGVVSAVSGGLLGSDGAQLLSPIDDAPLTS